MHVQSIIFSVHHNPVSSSKLMSSERNFGCLRCKYIPCVPIGMSMQKKYLVSPAFYYGLYTLKFQEINAMVVIPSWTTSISLHCCVHDSAAEPSKGHHLKNYYIKSVNKILYYCTLVPI